ncbi:MAG: hypothetical protein AMJ64_12850 [Betaproteobacteria bacterium SG8_39]|nr:MAG: hypothetical protein AMJ64_12850 [Betaproteobacteria bacterium SG8_39]
MAEPLRPGRSCPLDYRYGAAALAAPASLCADTLWVVGGVYGNGCALERVLADFDAEPGDKALVFNGDFHWFDVAYDEFVRVNQAVLAHRATRGNVESELARPQAQAGCGCAYPDWVEEQTVERSNRIIGRLQATARAVPGACAQLGALPMYLVAQVGGARVAIVHGDGDALAGWGFSQEALATPAGLAAAERAFDAAGARVFASSHSCLPVLQGFSGDRALVNNGAAGMPNFAATRFGIATRISVAPSAAALYRMRVGALYVEAVAIDFDVQRWTQRFLEQWPPGSDAHDAYFSRILNGPRYRRAQALRRFEAGAAVAA